MREIKESARRRQAGLAVFGRRFGEVVSDKIADKLLERLEDEDALPLPERSYDVVVDDPEMTQRHVYRALSACSARAAQVEGYRRAVADEGYRLVSRHPMGDEVTLQSSAARECAMYATVYLAGLHPVLAKEDADRRQREEAGA